jgi:hypothetical protein
MKNDTPLKALVKNTMTMIIKAKGNGPLVEKRLSLLARDLYEHDSASNAEDAKLMAYGIYTMAMAALKAQYGINGGRS